MILSHLWIVKSVAAALRRSSLFSADWDELISAGNLGLVKAARRFEGRNGCQFRTYAFMFVKGEMLRSFTRIDGHHDSALIPWEQLKDQPVEPAQEQSLYGQEKRAFLTTMLDQLKPHHRAVMRAYIDGRPIKRLAQEWGFKRDRVTKWQRTARRQLCAAAVSFR